jgi:hypothetical protein
MNYITDTEIALKKKWTDQFVTVIEPIGELSRFAGLTGRVITVNCGGRALVDFADGAWYDLPATESVLKILSPEEAKGKYDSTANSAQAKPARQS